MSGSPPTTLGKYHIIREIARSNDIVYEAYDPLMNRRVAVKELSMPGGSTTAQKEDRIKRFLREARAAGSLAHPNIMTVFEVGQESDRYFIAMEYLDGKTLRNELDTKGFLPPEKAVEVATAILEGLEYAHSKGVIHRDIKPDNVQLLSSGAIKLTDFGIARLTFEPNLTMDGQVFGTPSYMSPEQVVGRDIDARSDLFSVGVVLYEMLSGVKPFPGDSVVTITYAIMNKNPDRPQQINWALWQVVERALDKSPQLRQRSARDFIEELEGAMNASTSQMVDPRMQQANQQTQQGQTFSLPPPPLYPASAYGVPVQPPYGQQPGSPYAHQVAGVQPPYPQNASGQIVPPAYGMQVPVYYPPPPRKPIVLVSPETKRRLLQVFVYMVLLMAIAMFLIIAVPALLDSIANIGSKNSGKPGQATPGNSSAPHSQQPQEDPADALIDQGLVFQNNHDYDTAERYYQQAIRTSPKNPLPYFRMANLYEGRANSSSDEFMRTENTRRAAEAYAMSAQVQRDPTKRDEADVLAAQRWSDLASMYADDGDPRRARSALYSAEQHAHSDPKLEGQINAQLEKLSGSD